MARKLKKKPTSKSPPSPSWGVNLMRLTAFTATPIQFTKDDWKRMARIEPTEIKVLPKIIFSGPLEIGNLTINVAGDRVDLFLTPKPVPSEVLQSPILTIGNLGAVFESFGPIANKFFSSQRPIRRLAFGAILLRLVPDRKTAFKGILPYLHDLKLTDVENVAELFYQINRRRKPKTKGGPDGLHINRLSKWTAIEVRQATVPIDSPDRAVFTAPAEIAMRLELDISSNTELPKLIPNAVAKSLFNEFYALGAEIATKGDIA